MPATLSAEEQQLPPGFLSLSRTPLRRTLRNLFVLCFANTLGILSVVTIAHAQPPLVQVLLNASEFLPGQRLQFGYHVENGQTEVALYFGLLPPGGSAVVFFGGPTGVTTLTDLSNLAAAPAFLPVPPGLVSTRSGAIDVAIPTVGIDGGTYQFFAALVKVGGFSDNTINDGDVLGFDLKPINIMYSKDPRFEFEASVPSDQQLLVRQSVDQVVNFLRMLGAADLGAVTLFVFDTPAGLGQAYGKWLFMPPEQAQVIFGGRNGEATLGAVFLTTTTLRNYGNGVPVYHELFHVLQNRLVGQPISQGDFVPVAGPSWFVEGSAVYFQEVAADHTGLYNLAGARGHWLQIARGSSVPLKTLEVWAAWQAAGVNQAYALGFAAVDFLLSGASVSALLPMWTLIGQGASWENAFSTTFGRSIDTFYTQFEAYRAVALPPQ